MAAGADQSSRDDKKKQDELLDETAEKIVEQLLKSLLSKKS